MGNYSAYVIVDNARGKTVYLRHMQESLMSMGNYNDIQFFDGYTIFSGGDPEKDIKRWFNQGQKMCSVIHLETKMMGRDSWWLVMSFHGHRGMCRLISEKSKMRCFLRGVSTARLRQVRRGIVDGGMAAFREYCR